MKFNFKLDVKGVPTASCACEFECSPDELTILISDPVYQALGQKLVQEVSFKRSNGDNRHGKDNRFDALRRVVETEHKAQHSHNAAVDQAIRGIQDQVSRMLDEAVRNIKNKS